MTVECLRKPVGVFTIPRWRFTEPVKRRHETVECRRKAVKCRHKTVKRLREMVRRRRVLVECLRAAGEIRRETVNLFATPVEHRHGAGRTLPMGVKCLHATVKHFTIACKCHTRLRRIVRVMRRRKSVTGSNEPRTRRRFTVLLKHSTVPCKDFTVSGIGFTASAKVRRDVVNHSTTIRKPFHVTRR